MTAPYYQDDTVTLWHGDALAVLSTLPDGSADCIVTSPPYYGLALRTTETCARRRLDRPVRVPRMAGAGRGAGQRRQPRGGMPLQMPNGGIVSVPPTCHNHVAAASAAPTCPPVTPAGNTTGYCRSGCYDRARRAGQLITRSSRKALCVRCGVAADGLCDDCWDVTRDLREAGRWVA